jgi:hypothetical protein
MAKGKYFVIYSGNPYLLAELCVCLQMAGYSVTDNDHPFTYKYKWLTIYPTSDTMFFLHWEGVDPAIRLHITESNYIEVLEEILNNKK